MSSADKHDALLLNVLEEEGQIIPFLDVIFGFLQRRTDFYVVKGDKDAKIGFLPGVAEMVVRDIFKKWQKIASNAQSKNNGMLLANHLVNEVFQEEDVITEDESVHKSRVQSLLPEDRPSQHQTSRDDLSSDTYNGADLGHYCWSQTITEVEIKVPVPSNVTRARDVQVDVETDRISVALLDNTDPTKWRTLLTGQLCYKHLKDESIWTLLPGKLISIHLDKGREQWWERLLSTEQCLDVTKLDVTRHVTDLPEEDHMQVEKILVQEEQKRLGILPPEHQEKVDILKKAWNAEGSPFQGQPFDPLVLQLPQY